MIPVRRITRASTIAVLAWAACVVVCIVGVVVGRWLDGREAMR